MDRPGYRHQGNKYDQSKKEGFTEEGDQFETDFVQNDGTTPGVYDSTYPDPHAKNKKGNNTNMYGPPVVVRDSAQRDSYKQESYFQTGKASWYGREFHGKATASGEQFDMNIPEGQKLTDTARLIIHRDRLLNIT